MRFVAIDFETADQGADSACAVGLVKVEDGRIVEKAHALIRPPRRNFLFSYIHGIRWEDVAAEKTFAQLWPTLSSILEGAEFFAAHNAPFDKKVLYACCDAAGLARPALPFTCTVQLSRKKWNIRPTKLSDVCRHFNIALNHHEALSDAEACAKIVIEAYKTGVQAAL